MEQQSSLRYPESDRDGAIVNFDLDIARAPFSQCTRGFNLPRSSKLIPSESVKPWSDIKQSLLKIVHADRNDEVTLIRHGKTKYNERNIVSGQHDTLLSDSGRREATILRDNINLSYDLVACSALKRSYETMCIVMSKQPKDSFQVFFDPRLNEVNLGQFQGKRKKHIADFSKGNIDFAPPDGESYRDASKRIFSSLIDIFDALRKSGAPPRHALIFCHAGVMRIASTLVNSPPNAASLFDKSPKNMEALTLEANKLELADFWMRKRDGAERYGADV